MKDIEIGVYYFPNYHQDERNREWHGEHWTEWELVKRAEPRFSGHRQPKVPLWGYEDESDPKVMAKKIEAASNAGIDAFVFDWYWYEDGAFLARGLEDGFLGAKNNGDLKFALMWANHDWVDIHPAQRSLYSRGIKTLVAGRISEAAFVRATDHMIETYFSHPSYWRINGGLYLSFYMIAGLVEGLGGSAETRRIFDEFRARVRAAGMGELHLNAVVWEKQILPGEKNTENSNKLLTDLGFDSVTSYVWFHNHEIPEFPSYDYLEYWKICREDFRTFTEEYPMPYFPNVTMGWDSSPRTCPSDVYDNLGYPFNPILTGNTPEAFGVALKGVKEFLRGQDSSRRMFLINAWNEWTEGSYLEPDTVNSFGYLNQIKQIFLEEK